MGKTENKLALKTKLSELISKYEGMASTSKYLCPEFTKVFEEISNELKELDEICKERNRY